MYVFDLDHWDEAFFKRLKDFVREAGKRGVVVEFNVFYAMFSKGPDNGSLQLLPAEPFVHRSSVWRFRTPEFTEDIAFRMLRLRAIDGARITPSVAPHEASDQGA